MNPAARDRYKDIQNAVERARSAAGLEGVKLQGVCPTVSGVALALS